MRITIAALLATLTGSVATAQSTYEMPSYDPAGLVIVEDRLAKPTPVPAPAPGPATGPAPVPGPQPTGSPTFVEAPEPIRVLLPNADGFPETSIDLFTIANGGAASLALPTPGVNNRIVLDGQPEAIRTLVNASGGSGATPVVSEVISESGSWSTAVSLRIRSTNGGELFPAAGVPGVGPSVASGIAIGSTAFGAPEDAPLSLPRIDLLREATVHLGGSSTSAPVTIIIGPSQLNLITGLTRDWDGTFQFQFSVVGGGYTEANLRFVFDIAAVGDYDRNLSVEPPEVNTFVLIADPATIVHPAPPTTYADLVELSDADGDGFVGVRDFAAIQLSATSENTGSAAITVIPETGRAPNVTKRWWRRDGVTPGAGGRMGGQAQFADFSDLTIESIAADLFGINLVLIERYSGSLGQFGGVSALRDLNNRLAQIDSLRTATAPELVAFRQDLLETLTTQARMLADVGTYVLELDPLRAAPNGVNGDGELTVLGSIKYTWNISQGVFEVWGSDRDDVIQIFDFQLEDVLGFSIAQGLPSRFNRAVDALTVVGTGLDKINKVVGFINLATFGFCEALGGLEGMYEGRDLASCPLCCIDDFAPFMNDLVTTFTPLSLGPWEPLAQVINVYNCLGITCGLVEQFPSDRRRDAARAISFIRSELRAIGFPCGGRCF
ncbi:MAG: hypothetical protein AAGG07_14215 [Planctomycetota bacterium]